jgi:hypothetical protein
LALSSVQRCTKQRVRSAQERRGSWM